MSPAPAHFQTIATLARRLRSGELTPVAVAELFLDRIASLDPKLGAFRLVLRDRALGQARAAQAALQAGIDLGPLHGQPWVAKDLFDVKGHPTTAGTHLLADAIAGEDSAAVRRLEQAGMVLLGKTNTVQFAYGSTRGIMSSAPARSTRRFRVLRGELNRTTLSTGYL